MRYQNYERFVVYPVSKASLFTDFLTWSCCILGYFSSNKPSSSIWKFGMAFTLLKVALLSSNQQFTMNFLRGESWPIRDKSNYYYKKRRIWPLLYGKLRKGGALCHTCQNSLPRLTLFQEIHGCYGSRYLPKITALLNCQCSQHYGQKCSTSFAVSYRRKIIPCDMQTYHRKWRKGRAWFHDRISYSSRKLPRFR